MCQQHLHLTLSFPNKDLYTIFEVFKVTLNKSCGTHWVSAQTETQRSKQWALICFTTWTV